MKNYIGIGILLNFISAETNVFKETWQCIDHRDDRYSVLDYYYKVETSDVSTQQA